MPDGSRDDENRSATSFCSAHVEGRSKAWSLVHEGRVFTRSTNLPDRCVGKLGGRVPKSQSFVVKDAIHEPLTNNVCLNNRPAARRSQATTPSAASVVHLRVGRELHAVLRKSGEATRRRQLFIPQPGVWDQRNDGVECSAGSQRKNTGALRTPA